MHVLEARQASKQYLRGKVSVPVLRDITFSMESGEMICIMGPSGSGKSTLLNLLGLLDSPSGGEILIQDRSTRGLSYAESADLRSNFLGFIFQSFNLFPVLTAFENIEYPLLFLGLTKDECQERVWQALADVQLREVALQRPDELSGGQRQRVAIARALVTRPKLIIADEPTANLDRASAETVMAVMQRLNRERGTTFIFSTHDPRVVHHATRIVEISDGVLQEKENMNPVTRLVRA